MLNQSLDKEGEDGSSSFSANVLCRRVDSDSDPEFAIPINIHVIGLSTIYVCIIFCETKQRYAKLWLTSVLHESGIHSQKFVVKNAISLKK